jgi:tripartite-type tricarboxylate transporter receptor subunit TctC
MNPQSLLRRALLTLIVFPVFLALPVQAAYPEKPIRWIVPFPPGGAMDAIARSMGEQLARKFNQPVVIENRPGAGGNLGVEAVARAPADGYTMVITSIGMATNKFMYPRLSYDPQKDFAPVSLLAVVPNMLVVNPGKVQARNIRDLLTELRAKPGRYTYASAGNGTSIHLAGELFASMANVDILHVPYKGSGPAVSDLIGGQVDMMFDSLTSARPHIAAGRLVPLGLTTDKRSPSMPDVPTIAEAGLAQYELSPWFGVFMPAGTPREVLIRMHSAMIEVLASPEIKARFVTLGAEAIGSTPEAFTQHLAREMVRWEKLIRERNIRPD